MADRILVIEDDPSILRGLQLNLGMEGYTVRSAMDGVTGLEMARSEQPDLVVVDVMLPRLKQIVEQLRAEGNPVTLRPEISGKAAAVGSLEDVLAMAEEIPGVVPCIDFAHLHARLGDGKMNSYEEWMAALGQYRKKLGASALKHLHIHLSGINYGPKGEKNHLPIEDADLKFKDLMRALHDSKVQGRLMCESPLMEEDALRLKKMWLKVSGEKE